MGVRGPAPLPATLHLLHGNPAKKSPGALRDAIQVEVRIPEPPAILSEVALKEWERITPQLERLGLISDLYLAACAAYCAAWADWCHARSKLQQLEDGYVMNVSQQAQQVGAWMTVANQAEERMRRWASEFGLTPSARMRVTGGANPQGTLFPDDDPMAAYTAASARLA
jgi:P27 family predicted phage terminase small subunit